VVPGAGVKLALVAGIAERWGLAAALWPLLAAPLALLALVPGRSRRRHP
jgi:hypothetical protein